MDRTEQSVAARAAGPKKVARKRRPKAFVNWFGNVRLDVADILRPRSIDELVAVVARAASKTPRACVRAIGSRHSLCAEPFAGAPGVETVLVDLKAHLNRVVHIDRAKLTVDVEAGAVLGDLLHALELEGLTLPMLGSAVLQTVGGAVATGTHGSSYRVPACLSDHVVALQLLSGDGRLVWLTKEDKNRRLFDAARLSLGSLGIVTRLRLGVVPKFALRVTGIEFSGPEFRSALRSTVLEEPYHQWVYWFPYSGRFVCRLAHQVPLPAEPSVAAASWCSEELRVCPLDVCGALDYSAGVLAGIAAAWLREAGTSLAGACCGGAVDEVQEQFIAGEALAAARGETLDSRLALTDERYAAAFAPRDLGRLVNNIRFAEYAVDLARLFPLLDALSALLLGADDAAAVGPGRRRRRLNYPCVDLRFAGPTDHRPLLSVERGHDTGTAYIGFRHYVYSRRDDQEATELLATVEECLRRFGCRTHWAKGNSLTGRSYVFSDNLDRRGLEVFAACKAQLDPLAAFAPVDN